MTHTFDYVHPGDSVFNGILHIGTAFLRYASVTIEREKDENLFYEIGASFPFSARPLETEEFTIPLQAAPGERIFFKLELDNHGYEERIAIRLWEEKKWERHRNRRNFLLSGYISVNIFGFFFGFIVLTAIRAHFRFSYVYYFSVALLLMVTYTGIGYRYLWPSFPQVQNVMLFILFNATLLGSLRFLQRFFRTKWKLPIADKLIYVAMIGLGALATLALLATWMEPQAIGILQQVNYAWLILSCMLFLTVPILNYFRSDNVESIWFFAAYALHLTTLSLVCAQGLGLLWLPQDFERLVWIGVMNLHLVLSVVILFRIRGVVRKQAQTRSKLALERAERLRDLVFQEELERERIGADLHDEAGSRFAGIKMGLSRMAWNEENDHLKSALEHVITDVDKICDVNRELSHQLLSVSLNKAGLKEALREYQLRLRNKGRLVGFMYQPGTLDGLTESAQILVYRIILELVDGLYEELDAFRIKIEEVRVSSELLISAESIEGENLPAPEPESGILKSIRTRMALFHPSREEPVQVQERGVRIWLPKVVENSRI